MQRIFITIFTLFYLFTNSYAQNIDSNEYALNPGLLGTKAEFAVDGISSSLLSAVATVEKHPAHGPEYLWLRVYFYPFTLTSEEIAAAVNDNFKPIEKRWIKKDGTIETAMYNSQAQIALLLDKNYQVWQVDISVPGHSCTIAPFENDVKNFLEEYSFDGNELRLKSTGSKPCNIPPEEIPDSTYDWNINLNIPVFQKNK